MRTKYLQNLDRTFAILASVIAFFLALYLLFFSTGREIYVAAAILGFFGCLFYLGIRKRLLKSTMPSVSSSIKIKSSTHLILNILFFVLLSYSILSIYLRPEPYIRPLSYFISIILMVGVLGVEILFLPARKSAAVLVLVKIILIALSLRWSQPLIYPSGILSDPGAHQWFTTQIVNTGHIPEGWSYSKLPNMHLMIGTTSLITGLNYKIATMMSTSLFQVICDLGFVFLIGRLIWNAKAGLLGALLLATANHHINLGVAVIPTTAAATLIPIIIYLLLKNNKDRRVSIQALVILLFLALILTHTVTALCMAILLFVFWVGSEIYNRLYRQQPILLATPTAVSLFGVAMLGWWMYVSGHIKNVTEAFRRGYTLDWATGVSEAVGPEAAQYVEAIPFSGELILHIGMFVFFVFSILGCLYLLSDNFKNRSRFVLVGGGIIILFMGFAPWTYQMGLLHRWWYFSQILLAVPLAIFLLSLCRILQKRLTKAFLLTALILPLTFLMVMSPVANYDNDTFSGQMAARYALTKSELQAMDTIPLIWQGTVATDSLYLTPTPHTRYRITQQILTGNFTDCKDAMVLIREEAIKHPRWCEVYRLKYNPYQALEEQGFSKVYDCGSVSAFVM